MGFFGCDYLESSGTIFTEYRCRYSCRTLDSRTAQDICMTGRYVDCADYKNASRCFITTAVCLTLGKPDRCEELSTMRSFRDQWLRNQPGGPELIEDYYKTAPGIVEEIDRKPERKSIYEAIYRNYILPCVEHAKRKEFTESQRIYVRMVETLKAQYA